MNFGSLITKSKTGRSLFHQFFTINALGVL